MSSLGEISGSVAAMAGAASGAEGQTPPTDLGGGATGTMSSQQGLPPTGLQQQMQSLNALYQGIAGMGGVGYDVRQQQFQGASNEGIQDTGAQMGSSSLDQTARNLAQRYGLPIGNGRIVDEQGNFLYTPQQMADASGGAMSLGEAAAAMNYVSQAVQKEQESKAREQGMAALETGLGQVQSRGRGSLAGMMSGYYQNIADMYQASISRGDFEGADFSYYIQKEQLDIQQELMRRQEDMAKKQARAGVFGGIAMGAIGLASGQFGLAAGGFGQAFGNLGGTGWF